MLTNQQLDFAKDLVAKRLGQVRNQKFEITGEGVKTTRFHQPCYWQTVTSDGIDYCVVAVIFGVPKLEAFFASEGCDDLQESLDEAARQIGKF